MYYYTYIYHIQMTDRKIRASIQILKFEREMRIISILVLGKVFIPHHRNEDKAYTVFWRPRWRSG
jgi:hypothetical protein